MCKRMTWWKLTGETRRLANGLLCALLEDGRVSDGDGC
jgi:hypothetical protein